MRLPGPPRSHHHHHHPARLLAVILPEVRDIRREGSAALDLCSVACGRLDAYFESGLQPWDLAAGGLVGRPEPASTRWTASSKATRLS